LPLVYEELRKLAAQKLARDHSSLCGEQQERDRFLQIQADDRIGMTGIADRGILADVRLEVAAARGKNKSAYDSRRPTDRAEAEAGFEGGGGRATGLP
jgi:hypothetical protein